MNDAHDDESRAVSDAHTAERTLPRLSRLIVGVSAFVTGSVGYMVSDRGPGHFWLEAFAGFVVCTALAAGGHLLAALLSRRRRHERG